MTENLGAAARAATIFGEPVEREGITVIPVARARGVSAARVAGTMRMKRAGGGGALVTPVGFIELKNGGAEFRPIRTVSPP